MRAEHSTASDAIFLSSAYLAPVQYYTKLCMGRNVVIEHNDHYVKQTYRNRCIIAAPDGPLALTIPIEHCGALKPLTRDIRLSEHGRWRQLHWNALVSAYENSPYFFYYADDFRPLILEQRCRYLADFNEALLQLVLSELDLHPDITTTETYAQPPGSADDLREAIRPKRPFPDPAFQPEPYYQVFQDRNDFLPNLSIADLLFNMGPESRIILRRSIRSQANDSETKSNH